MSLIRPVGLVLASLVVLGLASARPASAQTSITLSNTPAFNYDGIANAQSLNGGTSGYFFTTGSTALDVTAVGYFDYNYAKPGTLQGDHTITFYQAATQTSTEIYIGSGIVGPTSAGLTESNSFTYAPLAPTDQFVLLPDTEYEVGGTENGSDLVAYNDSVVSDNTGTGYTYNYGAYQTTGSGSYLNVNGGNQGYFGPSFEVSSISAASAAPEPSEIGTMALMGLSLAGLLLRARKVKAVTP